MPQGQFMYPTPTPASAFALPCGKNHGDLRESDDLHDFESKDLSPDAISGGPDPPCSISTPRMRTPSTGKKRIRPRFLRPHTYRPQSSTRAPFDHGIVAALMPGRVLRVVSWNLGFSYPGANRAGVHTSGALAYLRTTVGQEPRDLMVMLQELDRKYDGIDFSDLREGGSVEPDFTLMMVLRTLPTSSCFRFPFASKMGRDALVVDIPVRDDDDRGGPKQPGRGVAPPVHGGSRVVLLGKAVPSPPAGRDFSAAERNIALEEENL
ncbi:hypothetical protein DL769_000735 [Monosporascus sp. CRB-8-3]|nr:hypothetical protein DL769_000735 [Monosporascus sp. CRB-8-3]